MDEGAGEFRVGRCADDDEQCDVVREHARQLVRRVADAAVVRDRDPATPPDLTQPGLVGTIGRKVVAVALDVQAGGGEDVAEPVAEVPVGEEDTCQAARS